MLRGTDVFQVVFLYHHIFVSASARLVSYPPQIQAPRTRSPSAGPPCAGLFHEPQALEAWGVRRARIPGAKRHRRRCPDAGIESAACARGRMAAERISGPVALYLPCARWRCWWSRESRACRCMGRPPARKRSPQTGSRACAGRQGRRLRLVPSCRAGQGGMPGEPACRQCAAAGRSRCGRHAAPAARPEVRPRSPANQGFPAPGCAGPAAAQERRAGIPAAAGGFVAQCRLSRNSSTRFSTSDSSASVRQSPSGLRSISGGTGPPVNSVFACSRSCMNSVSTV